MKKLVVKIKTISILGISALTLLFTACGNSPTANNSVNTTANTTTSNAVLASRTTTDSKTDTNNNTLTAETPERKQVLDALRIPVSQELKQDIIFKVNQFKTEGDWAFVSALPKNKDGGAPNWKITGYQEYIDNGDFEEGLYALLKKSGGKWTVLKYLMNCHDACYLTWSEDYKAPKSLFK